MDRAGDFLVASILDYDDLIKPGLDLWEVESMSVVAVRSQYLAASDRWQKGSLMDYPYATYLCLNG